VARCAYACVSSVPDAVTSAETVELAATEMRQLACAANLEKKFRDGPTVTRKSVFFILYPLYEFHFNKKKKINKEIPFDYNVFCGPSRVVLLK